MCLILLLPFLLLGCEQRIEEPEGIVIKVLAWDASSFSQQYGDYYLTRRPSNDLQVTSVVDRLVPGVNLYAEVTRLSEQDKPDLVVLPSDYYAMLSGKEGLLVLNDRIRQSRLELNDYAPAVLDALSDEKEQLYGLAPTFVGSGLYYNRTLFDRLQIPYPRDGMTWDEVFGLADRFGAQWKGEGDPAGLDYRYSDHPFLMALRIGESEGLSLYVDRRFTIHTESCANLRTCTSMRRFESLSGSEDFEYSRSP